MPSELNVNKISPASGTEVSLGDSGDTITIPSGVTLAGDGSNLTGVAPTKATIEALGIDLPAANLTGSIAGARLPDPLPAISGASLTNLPSSAFTSAVRVNGGGGLQLITKSTMTKIQFDTEVYDLGGEFDSSTNYRFTATDTGKYHVSLFVAPSTYTAETQWTVRIYKNGAYNGIRSHKMNTGSCIGIDLDVDLSANQYIEGFVWHNDSVDRNININHYDTVLSIHRIA